MSCCRISIQDPRQSAATSFISFFYLYFSLSFTFFYHPLYLFLCLLFISLLHSIFILFTNHIPIIFFRYITFVYDNTYCRSVVVSGNPCLVLPIIFCLKSPLIHFKIRCRMMVILACDIITFLPKHHLQTVCRNIGQTIDSYLQRILRTRMQNIPKCKILTVQYNRVSLICPGQTCLNESGAL